MKRSSRQNWLVKSQQAKAHASLTFPSSLSANVRSGANVLTKALQDRKEKSVLHLSKYVTDASKNLAAADASRSPRQPRMSPGYALVYGLRPHRLPVSTYR